MYRKLPKLLVLASLLSVANMLSASDDAPVQSGKFNIMDGGYVESLQPVMAEQVAWKKFAEQNGWSAIFEQRNGLPARAFGPPIELRTSGTVLQKAETFLRGELASFGMNQVDIKFESDNSSEKYQYLKFRQQYNGVEVMYTDVDARFDKQGRLVMFGLDVYDDVQVNTTPSISENYVKSLMSNKYAIDEETINIRPGVKILPGAENGQRSFNLIYEAIVYGENASGHFEYLVYIDAHSGSILKEQNRICNLAVGVGGSVTDNPALPKVNRKMPHIKVRYNSVNYFADADGNVTLPDFTGDATIKVYLEGRYAKVYKSNGSVPNYDITVNSSSPTISLTGIATDPEISAYYNVTAQHDFMKQRLPSFTGLDIAVGANINLTTSTCNAYYQPALRTVNFFKEGGGCNNSALFNDVIFHEYGHGINYEYSDFLGGDMQNGSLQEAYADVWAIIHSNNPVIAADFAYDLDSFPQAYIRKYDGEPRVYPEDIIGEVHYDGEIIAGAWWDLSQELGSLSGMESLFLETLLAKPDQPMGQEGKLFTQILLDVLLADDNDGNIANGTPNMSDIFTAFARHGITLFTSMVVGHTEDVEKDSLTVIPVSATLTGLFNTSMLTGSTLYYKKRGTATWSNTPATLSGSVISGNIPGQAAGTIMDYYFKLNFIGGQTLYCPTNVNLAGTPEFPFNALVGFTRKSFEDFDNTTLPGWTVQADAFTGNWILAKIVGSKVTQNINYSWSRDVQIGGDNTPSSTTSKCYVTANAGATVQAGTADVDSGRTILKSPVYNVSTYIDPVLSYYRFYTCDRGANPGTDTFKVYISNNDGAPVLVEKSVYTDWKWRRNVIRLKDYFPTPGNIKVTFVADDIYNASLLNGGGSLVEAAVDDIGLYDVKVAVPSGLQDPLVEAGVSLYPNPATDNITIQVTESGLKLTGYKMYDSKGAIVAADDRVNIAKEHTISVKDLPQGAYYLLFETSKGKSATRFVKSH